MSCSGAPRRRASPALGHAEDTLEQRTTTSGRPLRDVEVQVVDPETGRELPVGEAGELLVRGPTRFVRYHEDPEATAATIDADGWFHTGDLGRMDADGTRLVRRAPEGHAQGRRRERRRGRDRGLPRSSTRPSRSSQVVGAPDARYVEVPAAFVQLRAGAACTEQELIDFCRGRIATFKVPRYVRFVERLADVGDEDPEVPAAGAARRPSSTRPASPRRRGISSR